MYLLTAANKCGNLPRAHLDGLNSVLSPMAFIDYESVLVEGYRKVEMVKRSKRFNSVRVVTTVAYLKSTNVGLFWA